MLATLPSLVMAFDIQVVDQNGSPVTSAVVGIPAGVIEVIDPTPAIMDQVKRQFEPFVLAVDKGREVVFPNSDNIRHHVYSFSEPKKFQIKLYKDDPKKPIKFEKEGVVVLGCNIHDSMIGYIFVSPWPKYQVTPPSGQAFFEHKPTEIAIWHPWLKEGETPIIINIQDLKDNNYKVELQLDLPKESPKLRDKFKKFYNR